MVALLYFTLLSALSVVPHFFLSPPSVAFLTWGDFHARSCFARCTIPEEKWGTTRSLVQFKCRISHVPNLIPIVVD